MKKTNDGNTYWIEINNLNPDIEYSFQYFVDAKIKIADPYSTKIISSYDKFIPNSVYPDLISYPENMTHHAVSVVKTQQDEYGGESNDFKTRLKRFSYIRITHKRFFTDQTIKLL